MNPNTASDLLNLARAEPNMAKQAALLDKAEALALASTVMRNTDLLGIAAVHVDAANTPAALRCINAVLEAANGEVWNYRNAAKLLVKMNEFTLAAEALEACADAFGERRTQGYEWRLLAAGWADDLADMEGVVRCMAHATVGARSPDDHCSVATGLYELAGDEEGAREALLRAAEAAEHEENPHCWWTIANAYSAIGDRRGVAAALERGTAAANSVESYLTLAAAWHSQFPPGQGIEKCLASAAACAQTCDEWLQIAEAHFDYREDGSGIREVLVKALECAVEPSHSRRVAQGYRQFLSDFDTANSIAPSGLSPNEIAAETVALEEWHRDASALLNWLRPQMTSEALQSIAEADYGMDAEKNLKVLEGIVRTGLVPHPLEWNPLEVLQLTRWGEGASVDHFERAFACALLCIEGASGTGECSEADIIILLESCVELGPEAMQGAIGLMVALAEGTAYLDEDDLSEPPEFWGAAVLGLLLAAGLVDPGDYRLGAIASLIGPGVKEVFTEGMRPAVWQRFADLVILQIIAVQPADPAIQKLTRFIST